MGKDSMAKALESKSVDSRRCLFERTGYIKEA